MSSYISSTVSGFRFCAALTSQNKNVTIQYSSHQNGYDVTIRLKKMQQDNTNKNEKALRETQTLRAGCSKAEPNIFAQPQTQFPGAQDGQNLISWRWSLLLLLTQFGEDWCMQFRVIVVTDPHTHTHKQTHTQDRLQYSVPLSLARSVINKVIVKSDEYDHQISIIAKCKPQISPTIPRLLSFSPNFFPTTFQFLHFSGSSRWMESHTQSQTDRAHLYCYALAPLGEWASECGLTSPSTH